jgi:hypothetical protein
MSSLTSLISQNIHVVPNFTLECGTELHALPVAYKTWGVLNETRDNVMVICHAFTGSADVEDWCVFVYLVLTRVIQSLLGGVHYWDEEKLLILFTSLFFVQTFLALLTALLRLSLLILTLGSCTAPSSLQRLSGMMFGELIRGSLNIDCN